MKRLHPETWIALLLITACIVVVLALTGCQVPLRNY